jgi:TrmH family RNA methyltransferase
MLTSLQNPLIKQIRKLHTAKGRRHQQQFILEGTHVIEEACAVGYPLEVVCCTPDWQQQHQSLWELMTQQAPRIELIDQRVLTAIATTVHPDGIVATAPRFSQISRLDRQETPSDSAYVGLALETLQDPGNLGTMIRTAAAAGVEDLLLSADSVDLDHPKVLRASAGAWFRLPMRVCSDLAAELRTAQQQGIQVVATLPSATQIYWELDFLKPTIILLGNEGAGLSQPLIDLADQQVNIPLYRSVESLNVGICAALMLYEAQRQRSVSVKFSPLE